MNNTVTIYEFIGLILENKPPKKIFIKDGADLGEWYLHTENGFIEYSTDKHNTVTTLDWNYYIENQKQEILVKILHEENDEWEDIEECSRKEFLDLTSEEKSLELYCYIRDLIKNQKYLKERLDNVKDDVVFDYWKDKVVGKDE